MIKHLACIQDGNRRFAQSKGWLPWYGHREGIKATVRVVDFCLENNIRYLSLYTFSIENFRRSFEEVKYLFQMIEDEAEETLKMCREKNIQIKFIGDRTLFPKTLVPVCERLEQETKDNTALLINMLFCYGARQELTHGVKEIIKKIRSGELSEDDINPELVEQHLWLHGIPEPELIIRTGGVKRLSNFLLYQAAYSEFCFFDCLWPELTAEHLHDALTNYLAQKRNFGT
jgi:undecaprenyl diphosphate synthase